MFLMVGINLSENFFAILTCMFIALPRINCIAFGSQPRLGNRLAE
jgi:hypothetical protein